MKVVKAANDVTEARRARVCGGQRCMPLRISRNPCCPYMFHLFFCSDDCTRVHAARSSARVKCSTCCDVYIVDRLWELHGVYAYGCGNIDQTKELRNDRAVVSRPKLTNWHRSQQSRGVCYPGPMRGMSWCSLSVDKYLFNSSTRSL